MQEKDSISREEIYVSLVNPWLNSALAWLAVSSLFGLIWALPLASEGFAVDWGVAISGKWFLAWFGTLSLAFITLIFGWCFRVAEIDVSSFWGIAWKYIWNVLVAVGIWTIISGTGSGVAIMPIAQWLSFPIFFLILLMMISSIFARRQSGYLILPLCILASLAIIFLQLSFEGWVGIASVELSDNLNFVLFVASLPMILWSLSCQGLGKWSQLIWGVCIISTPFVVNILHLYWFCPLLLWWGAIFCFYLLKSRKVYGLIYPALLFASLVLVGGLSIFLINHPFGLLNWYLLPSGMVCVFSFYLLYKGHFLTKFLWFLGLVLLLSCLVLSTCSLFGETSAQIMSNWVVFLSFWQFASCLCLLFASLLWMIASKPLLVNSQALAHTAKRNYVQVLIFLGLLIIYFSGGFLLKHSPSEDSTTVKRAEYISTGADAYVGNGCNVCHAQVVLPNQLQSYINTAFHGNSPYRQTMPADFSKDLHEGVAHMGLAEVGPNLAQVNARIFELLKYEDASGKTKLLGSTQEWFAMHLYNPRDAQWNKPWSICPALNQEYFLERKLPNEQSNISLKIGNEVVVPRPEIADLIKYLSSLERGDIVDKNTNKPISNPQMTLSEKEKTILNQLDFTPLELSRQKKEQKRGEQIYLSKCTACHGVDGKGDDNNYPPLAGSDWLRDKPKSEIIDIIKNGLSGKIIVNGKEWDGVMLNPGVQSDDVELLYSYLKAQFAPKQEK